MATICHSLLPSHFTTLQINDFTILLLSRIYSTPSGSSDGCHIFLSIYDPYRVNLYAYSPHFTTLQINTFTPLAICHLPLAISPPLYDFTNQRLYGYY